MMISTSQRREKTLKMLKQEGSVQVSDLAQQFNVSMVTIRNDLAFFEEQGLATRAYGGAYFNSPDLKERAITDKSRQHNELKDKIARIAASLIDENDAIILDSGTTTFHIAEQLSDRQNLTVLTTGFNVANALADAEGVDLIIAGGQLRRKSLSMGGPVAESALNSFHFNKLFLGVDGFHLTRGITTHREEEARLNRSMCEAAEEIIVVTDSSKFGKLSLHKILETGKINRLVTDSRIPDSYLEGLKAQGVDVLIAE